MTLMNTVFFLTPPQVGRVYDVASWDLNAADEVVKEPDGQVAVVASTQTGDNSYRVTIERSGRRYVIEALTGGLVIDAAAFGPEPPPVDFPLGETSID
jgi:hypothetical protein